jgi:MoaA/NifB/PqqE/SkfB family radical SAM enzyme
MIQTISPIRPSLYWDDFERRIVETVTCIKQEESLPVRRVAVFITDRCNFRCRYCNETNGSTSLSEDQFKELVDKYGQTAIIHVTGGEPSMVPWLYPFMEKHGDVLRFSLNTNAYILPPAKSINRLKISLDHYDHSYWDRLVGKRGAFKTVVDNIKRVIPHTVVSITYTLTHENYKDAVVFAKFAMREFAEVYAVFFSTYKGSNPAFAFTSQDAEEFFMETLPQLKSELSGESLALLNETIDDKRRLIQGIRFPQNSSITPCYISMSERVVSPLGTESYCSHLYRDGIIQAMGERHERCLYGCNRRLVKFNEQVAERLNYDR